MTRKRYIKKTRYLLWRLLQLPCNQKNSKKDFYWSQWQNLLLEEKQQNPAKSSSKNAKTHIKFY